MGSTTGRSILQTNTRWASVAVYLLAACLGLGGWSLCLQADGRLLLKLKHSQCNGCVLRQLCPLSAASAKGTDCGPIGKSSCGSRHCCHAIPLPMIHTSRSNYRTQKFQPDTSGGPKLAVQKESFPLRGKCISEANSSDPPRPWSAVNSLRSTILII
jgi:hypothetical protein